METTSVRRAFNRLAFMPWGTLLALQLLVTFLLLVSPVLAVGFVLAVTVALPIVYLSPSLAYIAILASIPSQYAYVGTRGIADLKLIHIMSMVGFLAWLVQSVRSRKIGVDFKALDIPVMLIILWSLTTMFWATDLGRTLFANIKIITVFITYFVMIFLVKDKAAFNRILLGWLVVSLLWSAIGAYTLLFESIPAAQLLELPEGAVTQLGKTVRVSAVYQNPNELAFFLTLGIVLAVVNYRVTSRRAWQVVAIITILAGAIVLIGTFSRKSWLGVLLSLSIMFLRDRRIIIGVVVIGVLSVIFILLFAGTGFFAEAVYNRLASFLLEPEVAMAERAGVWAIALDVFSRSPIFGNGAGSFYAIAPAVGAELPIPHSLYLLILVEYGLVGLGLFVLYVSTCVYGLVSIMKKNDDARVRYMALGLLAILASVLFQGLFKTFSFTNYNFLAYFALTSIFLRIHGISNKRQPA
jgi:O-antigen ligase